MSTPRSSEWAQGPGAADRLRAAAVDVDSIGSGLTAWWTRLRVQAAEVPWESAAATAMRDRAADLVERLRQVADLCTEAAYALRRHAAAVEEEEERARRALLGGAP